MPRRQPVRPATKPALPQQVEAPPPTDDPTYQELLKAENDAYMAWLQYRPDDQHNNKQTLSALRDAYEERLHQRKAYQNKA